MKKSASIPFLALLFLLVTTSCTVPTSDSRSSATPSITAKVPIASPTSSGSTSQGSSEAISDVAMNYYQAIEKQNYDLAYTYLDPAATKFSRAVFMQEAQSQDKGEGKLQSYTAAAFPPMVVMTNMRVHLGPYHVHLQFKEESSTWKIVSLDGI